MDPTRSRGEYVGRLVKAAAEGLTGTFEVRGRGGLRRLHMREGEVVWSQTEDGGAVNAEEVANAVARPLAWEPCTVQFEEQRTLSTDATRARVSDPVPVRRALWLGAARHVALNDVLPSVIDPAAGPVGPTMGLWSALDELELEEPYTDLAYVLGTGVTVDELLRQIPDRSGILMKLVWFLERAELLERPRAAKPRPKTDPRGRVPRSPPAEHIRSAPEPSAATQQDVPREGGGNFSWWDGAASAGVSPPKSEQPQNSDAPTARRGAAVGPWSLLLRPPRSSPPSSRRMCGNAPDGTTTPSSASPPRLLRPR